MRHPRTPKAAQWCIAAALGYLMSPVDLIPDFIPVIGQLDDMLVIGVFVGLACLLIPEDVKRSTRQRTRAVQSKTFEDSGQAVFETEPLPGEFGVRIYRNNDAELERDELYRSLFNTLFDEKLLATDQALQKRMISHFPPDPGGNAYIVPYGSMPCASLRLTPSHFGNAALEFVDLSAAFMALPAEDQRRMTQLNIRKASQANVVPLVDRHPITGEPFLNIDFAAWEICGLSLKKNRQIVAALREHTLRRDFRYIHELGRNEIVAWDSTVLLQKPYYVNEPPAAGAIAYRLTLQSSRQHGHASTWVANAWI